MLPERATFIKILNNSFLVYFWKIKNTYLMSDGITACMCQMTGANKMLPVRRYA